MPNSAENLSLRALIQIGEVCHSLRSKKLFYQTEGDESPAANEAPFWCTRTQSIVGPDGQVADVESCRPSRGCCETA